MYRFLEPFHAGRTAVALLIIRGVVGGAFINHGLPKVQDVGVFASAMHLPSWLAGIAAWTEVLGGAAILLGLLTPIAAFFLAAQMLGALFLVHFPHHDPFVNPKGSSYELALVYLCVMAALLLAGPGIYSVDAAIAQRLARLRAPERRRGIA
jgi:putative oxidoreductase